MVEVVGPENKTRPDFYRNQGGFIVMELLSRIELLTSSLPMRALLAGNESCKQEPDFNWLLHSSRFEIEQPRFPFWSRGWFVFEGGLRELRFVYTLVAMKNNANTHSKVDRLSNALRIYGEERIKSRNLLNTDPVEAVDNLDQAFREIIESFHSVKDVFKEYGCENIFHDNPCLQSIVSVRNEIHHSADVIFESWNSRMFKTESLEEYRGATFLLMSHSLSDGDETVGEYYIPLIDFKKIKYYDKIDAGLCLKDVWDYAALNRFPEKHVYINMIPIVSVGATVVFSYLKENGFIPKFYDSNVYMEYFNNASLVLGDTKFKCLPITI